MDKPSLTPDQVVAYNLRRARELHGWTQDEAAKRLEPFLGERWSRVVFSAAERSVAGARIRQFSASQLVAFAAAFDLSVSFFLMPPRDVEMIGAKGAQQQLTPEQLIELAIADQDERVQELIEERTRDIYRLATRDAPDGTPGATTAMRELRTGQRATQRERAAALRAAQLKEQP